MLPFLFLGNHSSMRSPGYCYNSILISSAPVQFFLHQTTIFWLRLWHDYSPSDTCWWGWQHIIKTQGCNPAMWMWSVKIESVIVRRYTRWNWHKIIKKSGFENRSAKKFLFSICFIIQKRHRREASLRRFIISQIFNVVYINIKEIKLHTSSLLPYNSKGGLKGRLGNALLRSI